jgi:hypothetical protein
MVRAASLRRSRAATSFRAAWPKVYKIEQFPMPTYKLEQFLGSGIIYFELCGSYLI